MMERDHNNDITPEWLERTRRLAGDEAMARLRRARVAVFGVGGVGAYAVEVLARSGVGAIDLFDPDEVSLTNINRQLPALHSTVGRKKVDVVAERISDINPDCTVRTHAIFYLLTNAHEVDLSVYDHVVDCIDTVSAKMELVRRCTRLGVPIICSMGAANKWDPTAFRVTDISLTRHDPLARIMRKRLRREGITHFKCVISDELPSTPLPPTPSPEASQSPAPRRDVPASNAFVPAAAGIVVGAEVVKTLMQLPGV